MKLRPDPGQSGVGAYATAPMPATRKHVFRMLRKGGWFWIAVPFFDPVTDAGSRCDCSRLDRDRADHDASLLIEAAAS